MIHGRDNVPISKYINRVLHKLASASHDGTVKIWEAGARSLYDHTLPSDFYSRLHAHAAAQSLTCEVFGCCAKPSLSDLSQHRTIGFIALEETVIDRQTRQNVLSYERLTLLHDRSR